MVLNEIAKDIIRAKKRWRKIPLEGNSGMLRVYLETAYQLGLDINQGFGGLREVRRKEIVAVSKKKIRIRLVDSYGKLSVHFIFGHDNGSREVLSRLTERLGTLSPKELVFTSKDICSRGISKYLKNVDLRWARGTLLLFKHGYLSSKKIDGWFLNSLHTAWLSAKWGTPRLTLDDFTKNMVHPDVMSRYGATKG